MENSKERHGGDLRQLSAQSQREIDSLLDFSVNIRPEGMPEFLKACIFRVINQSERYPSPNAEEAKQAAAKHFQILPEQIVFGNGSNEVLHAALELLCKEGYQTLCTFEPAFSEYSIAAQKFGMQEFPLLADLPPVLDNQIKIEGCTHNSFDNSLSFEKDYRYLEDVPSAYFAKLEEKIKDIPTKSVIILANPANPSGLCIPLEICKKWVESRQDCIWIFDEAFIDYVAENADRASISLVSKSCMLLRSLTKFYAIASIRVGYILCEEGFGQRLQKHLPVWNVNGMALSCLCALFNAENCKKLENTILEDANLCRERNTQRRLHLYSALQEIEGIEIYPSKGNYVLCALPEAPENLWERMLKEHGIIMRNCSNYFGLEKGNYFRVAVRFYEDHIKLVEALKDILEQNSDKNTKKTSKKKTPALMLLGTSSNAGKSILAAAFCRILTQDGYKVKPFKAQNMSLNSGVTALGEEMGRAQIVQAQAAKVDPDARMNPVLLKPHSDTGSQVVLLGKAMGHYHIKDYYKKKAELWDTVCHAYDELAESCDIMVLEGAGSPAEVNLKEVDIVNLRMAEYAEAATLLVGDIDRGGIYASFLGTWATMTPREEKVLTGYLVNRFRGDATLLGPAHDYLEEHTGKPVLGVVPFVKDMKIPEEDMAGSIWAAPDKKENLIDISLTGKERKLDIAIIQLAHISNHTDFEALGIEPQCHVRAVRTAEEFGSPDVLILPGSKSVSDDLAKLRACGLDKKVMQHAEDNKWILGVCGGLQIMGMQLCDPLGVESQKQTEVALGLINISSSFEKDKTLTAIYDVESPVGTLSGYEIHHGVSAVMDENALKEAKLNTAAMVKVEESFWHNGRACGYVAPKRWATYVHGLFDEDGFRHAFLNHVREDLGLDPLKYKGQYDMEKAFDELADVVRNGVDMEAIYQAMGLKEFPL